MNLKVKAPLLIILIILCNFPFISTQEKSISLNSHTLIYDNNNVSFSLKTNIAQSSIDIFSIYSDYNSFHISNTSGFLIDNNYTNSPSITIPISIILNTYYSILDENYFISNNSKFIAVSTFSNINNNYILTIKDLQTNQTLLEHGQSPYKIALINSFDNSSDVYFSFYNQTMFTIAKYSFQYNNFTIYEHSKNLDYKDYFLSCVNVFFINNKIYASFTITDNATTTLTQSSNVLISNINKTVFNKTFSNMSIDFLTPSSLGFLFHSYQNSNFYDYRFSSNNYVKMPTFLPSIDKLKPFDNNSFIIITNQIMLCSFKASQTSSSIYFNESYNLQNTNYNKELFAFALASGDYYVVGIPSTTTQYAISIYNKNETPSNIISIPIITSTAYHGLPTTYPATTITSSNNTGPLLFLLLVIFVAIVLIAYDKTKEKRTHHYQSRDPSDQNTNTYQTQKLSTQRQNPIINRFCIDCGSLIEPNDVFCQNCGKRI